MGITPTAHGVECRPNAKNHDTTGEETQVVARAGSRKRRTRDSREGTRWLLHTSNPAAWCSCWGVQDAPTGRYGQRLGQSPHYSSVKKRKNGHTIAQHVGR